MKRLIILCILILTLFTLPVLSSETGTGLDLLTNIVLNDPGLRANIPSEEIEAGANASYEMNKIIIESIKATNAWMNGYDEEDIYRMNSYIRENYLELWVELHGDDENGEEWGFHYVQNDGATTQLYGENAVNTVADGVYHLGFEIENGRLLNEDGDPNVRIDTLAVWLNDLLMYDDFLSQRYEDDYIEEQDTLHVSTARINDEVLSRGEYIPFSVSAEGDDFDRASVRITCLELGISKKFDIDSDFDDVDIVDYLEIDEHIKGTYTCRIAVTTDTGITRVKHRDITLV